MTRSFFYWQGDIARGTKMSHFSVSKIKVRNPNTDLLKQVAHQLVTEMNGQLVSEIRSMEGNKETNFLTAFKTASLPYGVGVRVKNGEVELVGDFWGKSQEKKRLEAELTKNYTASAISLTLRNMGYQVHAQRAKQKVVLVAEH